MSGLCVSGAHAFSNTESIGSLGFLPNISSYGDTVFEV